jgi:hypothetical protein
MDELIEDLENTLASLRDMNEGPPGRSRELSIAITHFETGLLWLRTGAAKVRPE